jgi:hypothetical protein
MVLVTAAGGQNRALRELSEKVRHGTSTGLRIGKVIQTKFEEPFPALRFLTRMGEKAVH